MIVALCTLRKETHSSDCDSLAKGLAMEANEQLKRDLNYLPLAWKEQRELNVKVMTSNYPEPQPEASYQPPPDSHRSVFLSAGEDKRLFGDSPHLCAHSQHLTFQNLYLNSSKSHSVSELL